MIEIPVDHRADGIGVLAPSGRLNMVSARALRSAIEELVAAGHARIVLDLAETSFLDSSGLGAIIAGLKTARQAGGDLRIARPTPEVLAVFQLTNMDRLLRPRDTVDGAFDD
ncbi:STAS domain-containing protein [Nocardioides acrostichi]|uniref:Anti-sigma factor antagonist n=1 Tax=Nocardioides acrostichi TaxID=2784339 RepID=A0A930Y7M6_9ACTN|nr:STAS domain-containing protein [Nocardioides acrostichi]MBF4162156.1 STAS domain-containing protein [Nocardioides acrostichi]